MRRVALGSGLELAKLASTIRQIAVSEPPLPVLICQAESNPDAWVHLSLSLSPSEEPPTLDSGWMLILGYPLYEDVAGVFAQRSIALPAASQVAAWEPGLHATIRVPVETAPEEIARSIQQVMTGIQRVHPSAPVELALEYP